MNPAQEAFLSECRALNTWAELVCLTYEDANTDAGSLYDARIQDFCESTKQEWYVTFDPMHLKAMISECRNAFDFYGLCSAFKYYFREDEAYLAQRKQASAQKVWKRQGHGHRYPLSQAQVDALVSKATTLLCSNSFVDLVNGLCLVTGRRPYEVGVCGQLRLHREASWTRDQYCYYRGLAKTRNTSRAQQVLEIPVLLPPELVYTAWKRLRSLHNLRSLHPRYTRAGLLSLDSQYMRQKGSQLRKACTKHFQSLVPDMRAFLEHDITPQTLRKVYQGIVATQWHHEEMATPRFIAEILGHAGLGHADEYLDVYVKNPTPARFQAHFRVHDEE